MNTEILNDRTRAAIDMSRELQTKDNIDIHTANELLIARQFNQILEAIKLDKIVEKVEQSPKDFLEIIHTITEQQGERTKRLKAEHELEIYREEVAERKSKLQETIAANKTEHGLTPETLREIEEVMAQL